MRLNLGSGEVQLPGYVNLDGSRGDCLFPLDVPDDSCEEIRASHILEHFSHRVTTEVFGQWAAKVKQGGVLRVAVPNFRWVAQKYLEGAAIPTTAYVMGGHVDDLDRHGALFDEDVLTDLFQMFGFVEIRPWKSEYTDCASYDCSLNLEGWKGHCPYALPAELDVPEATKPEEELTIPAGSIQAVMKLPRLAFTDNMFCAVRVFSKLRIPLTKHTGVFWDHGITNLLLLQLELPGAKYALTLDYDTVFTAEDVLRLWSIMEAHPEIDALAPVQAGRNRNSPLFKLNIGPTCDSEMVSIDLDTLMQETMPAATAHFGLTFIRLDSLRDLPHPWFLGIPDEEGKWGKGRMDPDIAFWHRFREAGKSLHVANRVVVGHLQQVVSWPSRDFRDTVHQYCTDYDEQGKPQGGIWR